MLPKKAVENELYIKKIKKLLDKLSIQNKTNANYILAFIHRSLVNEKAEVAPEHNERLEFLWDAVLELSITDKLFNDFPDKPEWELTDIRSSLVRWKNLALVARKLWFNEYLMLWKWEELTWWRDNDYLLANCVESFIWALYLDLGYSRANDFILEYIYVNLEGIVKNSMLKDYKSVIQEYAQEIQPLTPSYKILSETWPDHNKTFVSWIYIWDLKIWEWTWTSKKKSQEDAAENAYNNRTDWNKEFIK